MPRIARIVIPGSRHHVTLDSTGNWEYSKIDYNGNGHQADAEDLYQTRDDNLANEMEIRGNPGTVYSF